VRKKTLEVLVMNEYKVCYYVNASEHYVDSKVFPSLNEAIDFANSLPQGDVLEIKRIENAS
jgi:hypothetical protein